MLVFNTTRRKSDSAREMSENDVSSIFRWYIDSYGDTKVVFEAIKGLHTALLYSTLPGVERRKLSMRW